MDLGLRDRAYLVTGGSRGLGFAAAQALVAEGARVLLSAPHQATAAWIVADNADPAAPAQLITAARDRFGRLDGALISVGGSPAGTIEAAGDDAWRSAFETVFLGAVRLVRALAADLSGTSQDGGGTAALTGTGGSIAFVLSTCPCQHRSPAACGDGRRRPCPAGRARWSGGMAGVEDDLSPAFLAGVEVLVGRERRSTRALPCPGLSAPPGARRTARRWPGRRRADRPVSGWW